MLKSGYVFVLAIFIQVANSQDPRKIPDKCKNPPPVGVRPLDCCDLPQLFRDADFDECGFNKSPPMDTFAPQDCTKDICMLKRYSLLKKDDKIDYAAVAEYLDNHSVMKPQLKEAFLAAKERCVPGKLTGPDNLCEHHKLIRCITGTLFSECPTWQKSDACKALKAVIDECRKFFENYSF